MVQTRPKLTLSAGHMTQPIYNISDVIIAWTYYTSDVTDALAN